jgi:hypothetical protein
MSMSASSDETAPRAVRTGRRAAASAADRSDWNALLRLADAIGGVANPVTQVRGRHPTQHVADNGGAQALCIHDDAFEGVVTSDGTRYEFKPH